MRAETVLRHDVNPPVQRMLGSGLPRYHGSEDTNICRAVERGDREDLVSTGSGLGLLGGRRPRMAAYVAVTGTQGRATAAGRRVGRAARRLIWSAGRTGWASTRTAHRGGDHNHPGGQSA